MRTAKILTTISYNSPGFLVSVLNQLIQEGSITYWMFISHFREEDETKDHIHLCMMPNKLLDTLKLKNRFLEYDLDHPSKPLGVIDFRTAKDYDDWILYCQHYAPYLASKGESRKYEYSMQDFLFSDELEFEYNYNHAFKGSEWVKSHKLLEELSSGFDPYDLIRSGRIPFSLSSQAVAFGKLQRFSTCRGGRENHENNEMSS